MGERSVKKNSGPTHWNENLDPFWIGSHECWQILLMVSKREEKSGKVETPRCTHPINSLDKDASCGDEKMGIQFNKAFDI